jgi:menaquinone-dependent protoporphyrinogen oxidase
MGTSILVAYATRAGSTREVAEAVAAALREAGMTVACQIARDSRVLDGFDALVLGAPLYMFKWEKDAKTFLLRHRNALNTRPVAIFALGPMNDVEQEFTGAREQLDKELANFPWLKPVAVEVFGGKFDPADLRFPMNLIPALRKMPASDIRKWDLIRAWANEVAALLQPTA